MNNSYSYFISVANHTFLLHAIKISFTKIIVPIIQLFEYHLDYSMSHNQNP